MLNYICINDLTCRYDRKQRVEVDGCRAVPQRLGCVGHNCDQAAAHCQTQHPVVRKRHVHRYWGLYIGTGDCT